MRTSSCVTGACPSFMHSRNSTSSRWCLFVSTGNECSIVGRCSLSLFDNTVKPAPGFLPATSPRCRTLRFVDRTRTAANRHIDAGDHAVIVLESDENVVRSFSSMPSTKLPTAKISWMRPVIKRSMSKSHDDAVMKNPVRCADVFHRRERRVSEVRAHLEHPYLQPAPLRKDWRKKDRNDD